MFKELVTRYLNDGDDDYHGNILVRPQIVYYILLNKSLK